MAIKLNSRFSSAVRFELDSVEECLLSKFGAPKGSPRTEPGGLLWEFWVTDLKGENGRIIQKETGSTYGLGAVTQLIDSFVGRPLRQDEIDELDVESFVGISGVAIVAQTTETETGVITETLSALDVDKTAQASNRERRKKLDFSKIESKTESKK